MSVDQPDIKNNISLGAEIFEELPNDFQPFWAAQILSCFDGYVNNPPEVLELFSIIRSKERWSEAHGQFNKIRSFLLCNKKFKPETYLLLAELVAKVTYNASGSDAPFDSDSGHFIPSTALFAAEFFKETRLEQDVKSAILLSYGRWSIKRNLTDAESFLLYRQIDNILWFHWDPIGVREHAPRDEYQDYVLPIFSLVKANVSQQKIAEQLYQFETVNMGLPGSMENCLDVARRVVSIRL